MDGFVTDSWKGVQGSPVPAALASPLCLDKYLVGHTISSRRGFESKGASGLSLPSALPRAGQGVVSPPRAE